VSRPRRADPEAALLAGLEALYADVDARYAGHGCPASADCCHFFTTGREPYVTSLERAALLRAVRARGGRLPRPVPGEKASRRRAARSEGGPRALPVVGAAQEWVCPLLTRQERCSVYTARPLGCRTYYCERAQASDPVRQQEINAFVRRLKALAEQHERGGDLGRPLTRALGV
jgi:Fe-S-cluster containining protein